jgi:hypothetical protein
MSASEIVTCSACGGYVHPFLGACPACGLARRSSYEDALAGSDLGLRALAADPYVDEQVRQVVLRYTMKRNRPDEENRLRPGLATVAGAILYRVRVAGARAASSEHGAFELTDEAVLIREKSPIRDLHRVPLEAILAIARAGAGRSAGSWTGLVFEGRLDPTPAPTVDGDLVVTSAGEQGLERLALSNRRGIFAARARADHFQIMTSWLGMLAGAAAEARWTAVGARRHAAEIGLAPVEAAAGAATAGDATAGGAAASQAAGAATVRKALEELEELRAAGLVSADEYAVKRREILARL